MTFSDSTVFPRAHRVRTRFRVHHVGPQTQQYKPRRVEATSIVGSSYDQDIQLNRNRPPGTSVLRKMSDAPGRNLSSFFKRKPQVTEADKARLHAEGQARRDAQAAEETARRHAVDMLLRSWHVPQEPIQKKESCLQPPKFVARSAI